jgi:hypothetical protein
MQGHYAFEFEREMGCTADELRAWLPGASGDRPIAWHDASAVVGTATLTWRALPPRRIALITLPRLHVRFVADRVAEAAWQRFMRHFDLYTQRGGG